MAASAGSMMRVKGSASYVWFLDEMLGKGAMGCVYVGRHRKLGHKVAIKVPNLGTREQYRDLYKRELELLQNLGSHKNIVTLIGIEKETYLKEEIIIMELCTGGSLHTILDDPKNYYGMEESEFLLLLSHLNEGLHHLWIHGIVHRDVKPGNILLCIAEDGSHIYKITDFGAAKDISDDQHQQFYSLFGTEEYLFPDMHRRALEGEKTAESGEGYDFSVDLWSLGVTIYQCVTGKLPFRPYKGVRRDRKKMQELTAQKAPGVISQVEESDGSITSSRELPPTCPLSRGTQEFVVQILANILETNPDGRWNCHQFHEHTKDFCSRRPLHVFNFVSGEHLIVYMEKSKVLSHMQETIAHQTGISAADQHLFYANTRLEEVVTSDTPTERFPETSEDKPILVVPTEMYLGTAQPASCRIIPEAIETTDGSLVEDVTWSREASAIVHCVEKKAHESLMAQVLMLAVLQCLHAWIDKSCLQTEAQVVAANKAFATLTSLVESWIRQGGESLSDLGRKVSAGYHLGQETHEKLTRKVRSVSTFLDSMKHMQRTYQQRHERISQALKNRLQFSQTQQLPMCQKSENCQGRCAVWSEEAHNTWVRFKEDKRTSLQHNEMELHKFHKSELRKIVSRARGYVQQHCLINVKRMTKIVTEAVQKSLHIWKKIQELDKDLQAFDRAERKLVTHMDQMIELFPRQILSHQWCSRCRKLIAPMHPSGDQGYGTATGSMGSIERSGSANMGATANPSARQAAGATMNGDAAHNLDHNVHHEATNTRSQQANPDSTPSSHRTSGSDNYSVSQKLPGRTRVSAAASEHRSCDEKHAVLPPPEHVHNSGAKNMESLFHSQTQEAVKPEDSWREPSQKFKPPSSEDNRSYADMAFNGSPFMGAPSQSLRMDNTEEDNPSSRTLHDSYSKHFHSSSSSATETST